MDYLPSPPASPPPTAQKVYSLWFDQEKPTYQRTCLGCFKKMIWQRWMTQDGDHGRWYTLCDRNEDGCEMLQWAVGPGHFSRHFSSSPSLDNSPTLPSICYGYKRQRTISAELSPSFRSNQKRQRSMVSSVVPASSVCARQRSLSVEVLGSPSGHTRQRSVSLEVVELIPPPTLSCPPAPNRIWPFDFYADEMDAGFKKCGEESNRRRTVEEIFSDHFGTKFVRSTFYDHRRHWTKVSSQVRDEYIGYGRTESGRWSVFLRNEIKGKRVAMN